MFWQFYRFFSCLFILNFSPHYSVKKGFLGEDSISIFCFYQLFRSFFLINFSPNFLPCILYFFFTPTSPLKSTGSTEILKNWHHFNDIYLFCLSKQCAWSCSTMAIFTAFLLIGRLFRPSYPTETLICRWITPCSLGFEALMLSSETRRSRKLQARQNHCFVNILLKFFSTLGLPGYQQPTEVDTL